ncbi:2-hydroxy-6-oxo-6-phenylhexa-2,4-dienoate hydrolase [Rosistilla ulvae]|uniref:2-hydroxy-6-oxo-6-phenylhexa-2,4-dienoate hydrolase n=1 Tax=Rosistilla ulvae TaxID=1930277 RepID=A0A517LZ11_9BACT|nr:alpha/beta hydrolase [Rosistilla ulvae]QDS87867.1 2-hydroxy-6-oxo-6-phenylhexa-2,4-dienoate hydrolase [Rosistilla ulvae]
MNFQTFQQRQKRITLDGIIDEPVTVAYTDVGAGEPLVLLHGIPTWSFLFHEIIEPLSQRYRVIAPDLLGYGFSDHRDRFDRSIEVQADMVERFLAELDIPAAHFVAHDIGGGVALILADRSPDLVRTMVLSNSVAYDSWPIDEMLKLGHPRNAKMEPADVKQFLEEAFKVGLSRPDRLTDEFRTGISKPYLQRDGIISLVRNAASLNTNHTTKLTERIKLLKQPTLLLWGVDDRWQPVSTAEQLVKEMPNAKLRAIENCSHWVPQDAPQEFTEAVLGFLDESV